MVLTHSGKCLVHCPVGAYAQHPTLKPGPLCQLLTVMQEMAGRPAQSYVELHGLGVVLLEGHHSLIGAVCEPTDGAIAAARLVAMQALNVFGKLYRAQVQALDEAHSKEARELAESYTVHSAVKDAVEQEIATLPQFALFAQNYVQPLLLSASPGESWLQPLVKPSIRADDDSHVEPIETAHN